MHLDSDVIVFEAVTYAHMFHLGKPVLPFRRYEVETFPGKEFQIGAEHLNTTWLAWSIDTTAGQYVARTRDRDIGHTKTWCIPIRQSGLDWVFPFRVLRLQSVVTTLVIVSRGGNFGSKFTQ